MIESITLREITRNPVVMDGQKGTRQGQPETEDIGETKF